MKPDVFIKQNDQRIELVVCSGKFEGLTIRGPTVFSDADYLLRVVETAIEQSRERDGKNASD